MRFTTFEEDGRSRLGVVTEGSEVLALSPPAGGDFDLGTALAFWGEGKLRQEAEAAIRNGARGRPVAQLKLRPPIARPPKNIVCVARNYLDHAQEAARFGVGPQSVPEFPMFFSKPATTLVGHGDDVIIDQDVTGEVDYEGELAVIIGRAGVDIPKERAFEHVFGYTVVNDVTARDLQRRYRQYYKGKGLDTFGPMGPFVVTRDEIGDPRRLRVETRVNGELRQSADVADLIFDIPTVIEEWSRAMTLEPGDVLCTGTPAGVGAGFDPPRFLGDGDVVEVTIPGLGTLRNTFRVKGGRAS